MSKESEKRRKERRALGLPSVGPDHPRIESHHTDPNGLIVIGPAIPAAWSVPPALSTRLAQAQRPIPPTVRGYLLIDTGATHLCIAQDVAEDLQLRPVRLAKSLGAHGEHEHEVFEATVTMEFSNSKGEALMIQRTAQVQGVPRLNEMWSRQRGQLKVAGVDVPLRLIGLLGRDFLRHAKLVYDGAQGRVVLSLDPDFVSKFAKR